MAFCYFVAQSHLKIDEVGDYRKLYFIVDDPVSSVSFDYVYCICQILKTLRIDGGDIRINTNGSVRPKMLKADLQAFLNEVNSQHGVQVRSVLIQDMSHGGKMWTESPLSADIETACKEAVEILRYYAPGQVEGVDKFEGVLSALATMPAE